MPPISFNKPFKFLLYTTNRLHFPACVYCNRPQKTSQHVNNNSHTTRRRLVSCVLSCSLHAVTSYVIYYSTHTEKCYLFVNFTKSSSSPSRVATVNRNIGYPRFRTHGSVSVRLFQISVRFRFVFF